MGCEMGLFGRFGKFGGFWGFCDKRFGMFDRWFGKK
jgi:hypothetical protein